MDGWMVKRGIGLSFLCYDVLLKRWNAINSWIYQISLRWFLNEMSVYWLADPVSVSLLIGCPADIRWTCHLSARLKASLGGGSLRTPKEASPSTPSEYPERELLRTGESSVSGDAGRDHVGVQAEPCLIDQVSVQHLREGKTQSE